MQLQARETRESGVETKEVARLMMAMSISMNRVLGLSFNEFQLRIS